MSTIKVQCIDQVLTLTHTPVIASGGIEEDHVQFSFCPQWDGFAKTAVFWRTEDDAYHVLLDDTGTGVIPAEVLVEDGVVYFGVFGVNADQVRRTSEVLRYSICRGAYLEGSQPAEPTPSIYEQLLASYAEAMQVAGDMDEAVYDPTGAVKAAGGIQAYGSANFAPKGTTAGKSKVLTGTLGTSWANTSPPTQTIQVVDATADNVVEVSLPATATAEQVAAYQALNLQDGGQAAGSITLRAFGTLNQVAIPLTIIVRGDV